MARLHDEQRHWFITETAADLGRHLTSLRCSAMVHHATIRRSDALDDLQKRYDDRLTREILDLTRPADIDAVIDRTLRAGRIDIVVNNAGYAVVGAEEMSVEQVHDPSKC